MRKTLLALVLALLGSSLSFGTMLPYRNGQAFYYTYNARKVLDRLVYPQNPMEELLDLAIPPGHFQTLPGTETLIFGAEAVQFVEEAWYQASGLMSVYAVDPEDMANTPLDFDLSSVLVTNEGKIIFSPTPPKGPNGQSGVNVVSLKPPFDTIQPIDETDPPDMGEADEADELDDEEDDEPPLMIVTRLPRLLGINVDE